MSLFRKFKASHWHYLVFLGLILGLNILIRVLFINYGYITTDEGIAYQNTKLAYSGLKPFIDYNGWNSLINDYLMGWPHLFTHPTLLSQRYYSMCLALLVLILTLKISSKLGGHRQMFFTSLFITFGFPTYLYFSNLPYSFQPMTLLIMFSIYLITLNRNRNPSFSLDFLALVSLIIATLVRSQTLPLVVLTWFYFYIRQPRVRYHIKLLVLVTTSAFILFAPFFLDSPQHTFYALFWPFFANKILLYVALIPPFEFSRLLLFVFDLLQDYGVFVVTTVSALIAIKFTKIKALPAIVLLCLVFSLVFVATALIHHPADASYLYPAAPIFALTAAYFMDKFTTTLQSQNRIFVTSLITLMLVTQFVLYPHFKVIRTSVKMLTRTPFQDLQIIKNYILANSNLTDSVVTFYLPAVTELNRNIPKDLNEGAGSISIMDEKSSYKYHLTNIAMFQRMIKEKKVTLIIFPTTARYYFGVNESERNETIKLIQANYSLTQSFPEFNKIDGSKAEALDIYRLPD